MQCRASPMPSRPIQRRALSILLGVTVFWLLPIPPSMSDTNSSFENPSPLSSTLNCRKLGKFVLIRTQVTLASHALLTNSRKALAGLR